ncbi:hypothetical protein KSW81_008107 [Nannochloris sp. 'desiccata']|nr:hypothetical protein KSW81_008107 [Chlorella desiccata (nom. nud.)]
MSTPSNPQSVQQPEHDQVITDEVISLVDQPASTSDEEMIELGSESDAESPQKEEPKSKRLKGGIRDFLILISNEAQPINGNGNQQSAVDGLVAAAAGSGSKKREYAKEEGQRKFQSEWVDLYPWLRMTPAGNLFCNACSIFYKKPVLMKNYKVCDLNKHQNTANKHPKAMAAYQGGEYDDLAVATTNAIKTVDNSSKKLVTLAEAYDNGLGAMRQKQFQNKLIQFMTIFQLLKHHRPMSDYEWR